MRLPLASDLLSRDGSLTKDARLTNCFVEAKGEKSAVVSRPGIDQKFDLTAGNGNGMVAWKGALYAVCGNTLTQGPTELPITDGATWSSQGDPLTQTLINVCVVGTELFAFCANNYVFKTADGTNWTTVTSSSNLPASFGMTMRFAYLGGYIYAIQAGQFDTYKGYVWRSADGISWTQVTASAGFGARSEFALLAFGNKLYVIGGYNGSYLNSVFSSTDGNAWTQVTAAAAFPVRWIHSACVHNNAMWIAGGYGGSSNLRDVWSSTDGATWTQATASADWPARYGSGFLCSYNGKLWVIGDGSTSLRDVWSSSSGASWTQATSDAGFTPAQYYVASAFSTIFAASTVGVYKAALDVPGGSNYTVADFPTNFTSTSDAAATDYLFLKNNTDAWVLTFGSPGTLTQVTDADYPATTVPGCAYLDGYIFVMDEAGTIYNSALEDPLSWNSLDYLTAESEPDAGVALVKHNNYIVALKSTSIEAFYDAANPSGSPLAPVSNSPYKIGCANGWSVAEVDGKVFFLSQTNSQGKSVHFFPAESVTPTEAATEDVKRILASSELATVRAFAMRMSGHTFYVLNLLSDGVSLVYDLTTGLWATWTYRAAASPITLTSLTQADGIATATKTNHGFSDGDLITHAGATPSGYNVTENITVIDANTYTFPVSSALTSPATGTITATGTTETHFPFSAFCSAGGVDYIQHEDSGIIYEISPAYTTDDGQYIDVHVRLPKFDGGDAQRKTIGTLEIIGDKVSANALVRWSDDDYATYSKYRRVNLGNERSRLHRLGSFSRRAFELRFTDDAQMRLSEIEI